MLQETITKIVYHGFDIINRKRITYHFKEAKKSNESLISRNEDLEEYLKNWNVNPRIKKNPLMFKKDVIEFSKQVDPKNVYSWAYTGGSFGEPLKMPYSKERNHIRTGTFKYFNEIGGYNLGSPFAIIRAKKKSTIVKILRNETIIIPTDVSEDKLLQDIQLLKKHQVTTLLGYPTVMYELAILLDRKPELKNELKIKSLISTSEMLEDEKRYFVQMVFNCKFIDRYSNEEVGVIAQQREFGGDYEVNQYGVYVEVLDPATLLPVNTGEEGKVVVTDTLNDLLPIVRYDTGDLAIAGKYVAGELKTIKKVVGRTTDQLTDSRGNPVSSLALGPLIYKPLAKAEYNIQFQLVQEDENNYILKLKIPEEDFENLVKQEILKNLREKLGPNSNINFSFVKDIPPMRSGKRPVYINNLKLKRVR